MQLKLTNKVLPFIFVRGLVNAIISVMGYSGGTPALLNLAIEAYLPLGNDGKPSWTVVPNHQPLWSYYREGQANFPPVDFAYLSLLLPGIVKMYGLRGAKDLSRRIGQKWWSDRFYSFYMERAF